ncbi:acetyltransferase [Streptomyces sp. HPF1205]|uniref:acetyltransferase n=1 Tax=Streptomyces sp. HPF1205 TaxID=2873262 RepID=UPI0027DFD8EA|nr:acetyltransferase [Streptomyces sp. HPF1205]
MKAGGGAASGGRGGGRGAGEPLLIVGAGGFAREAAQAVRDVNRASRRTRWRLLGHLDDDPCLHGREVDGVPVLGASALAHEMPDARVLVCVGSPRDPTSRARVVRRLGLDGDRWATLVHPAAAVSATSSVGPGCVLLAHCAVTAAVRVGAHVAVMPQVVLTHDDVVEDFATLASGARLGGGVRLARGAYAGAGALIRENVTVGAWSLVGMGGVVLGDVPPGEIWAGNPARRLRAAGAPALAELRTKPRPEGGARPAEGVDDVGKHDSAKHDSGHDSALHRDHGGHGGHGEHGDDRDGTADPHRTERAADHVSTTEDTDRTDRTDDTDHTDHTDDSDRTGDTHRTGTRPAVRMGSPAT